MGTAVLTRTPRPADVAGCVGAIYLLHFEPAFRHAQHYLGWAQPQGEGPLDEQLVRGALERVRQHREVPSAASPLVRAALAAGVTVTLVRLFAGTRVDERGCKRAGGLRRLLCPCCAARAGRVVYNRRGLRELPLP